MAFLAIAHTREERPSGNGGKMTLGGGSYCFDVEALAGDEFDLGAFLEDCRARNPMETIHQDLKQFQTALENQLVAIINEDYAEFLQLSSKLKGVDEAVSSVRSPILAILKRVDQVQAAMSALDSKIRQQIQTAKELQKEEADLKLSIGISEKLLLLEELLDISSPVDSDDEGSTEHAVRGDDDDDDDGFDNFDLIKKQNQEASAVENCAKLERATLLFLGLDLAFLEGIDIPAVQREEKRLTVIEDMLLRRLETEFATEIFPDTFYNRDHAISASTLSYLLRSYVLLQKSHIPEEMIARLLVQPFAEENLTRGRLDGGSRGSCSGLQQIYDSILEFIASKFNDILALPICQGESKCSVDILGNAVWKPLQEILVSKHSIIFQAADPDRFHQNYTISMKFLSAIEDQFCSTSPMKTRFRCHESVVEFKEKWNLDVYFQLRYNQLSLEAERSFSRKRVEVIPEAASEESRSLLLFESTKAIWSAMNQCWDERIFLLPVMPNLTKLCLQLLVYYIEIWRAPLLDAIEGVNSGSKVDFETLPLCFVSTEEDILGAGSDFANLNEKVATELFTTIKKHLQGFTDDADSFVTELFENALNELSKLEESCWTVGVTIVTTECKKILPALRTVKGQYQMTNKPAPSTASSYVSNIVGPVAAFLDKWGLRLDSCKKQTFLQAVMSEVCTVYSSLSTDLLRSALELEESLKSRKLQRHSTSRTAFGGDAMSDTEKMRLQLLLDLQEMQRQMEALGFDSERCEPLHEASEKLSTPLSD